MKQLRKFSKDSVWKGVLCMSLIISQSASFSVRPHMPVLSIVTSEVKPRIHRIAIMSPFQQGENIATNRCVSASSNSNSNDYHDDTHIVNKGLSSIFIPFFITSATLFSSSFDQKANAYEVTDYTSETVTSVLKSLQDSKGDKDATFRVYERIAAIITEGQGVGGSVDSGGVELERGFVTGEDTTIFNPGLSILTESEKERLVDALIQNRKQNLAKQSWSKDTQSGFESLKERLDPLHMTELSGFLRFLPIYGGILYLTSLAAQQFQKSIFPFVYIVSVIALVVPIVLLVATGV